MYHDVRRNSFACLWWSDGLSLICYQKFKVWFENQWFMYQKWSIVLSEPWKKVPRNEHAHYFSDALLCFAAKPLHAIRKMFIGIFTVNKNLWLYKTVQNCVSKDIKKYFARKVKHFYKWNRTLLETYEKSRTYQILVLTVWVSHS